VIADVVGLVAAYVVALVFVGAEAADAGTTPAALEVVILVISLPLWIALGRLFGLYRRDDEHADHSTVDDFAGVCAVVTIGTWLFVAGAWLLDLANPYMPKMIAFWLGAVILVTLSRGIARAMWRRSPAYVQNTLILGADAIGQRVAAKILRHPEYGINVVGFVDTAQSSDPRSDLRGLRVIGEPAELPELVEALDVERVILAFSDLSSEETVSLVRGLNEMDVQVEVVPRLYEVVGPQVSVHAVEGLPLVAMPRPRLPRTSLALKRGLDVTLAGLGLLLLSPVFAAIAVAIKLDSLGPVFFRQERRGRGSSTFRIVKFRTMGVDAEARKHELADLNKHLRPGGDTRMFKAANDPRVTRVGRILRRTSFDELPQLWNVLKGEMSLVGPRPLILEEDEHVEGWGEKRLDLRPGITGLWQVLGRDDIPFGEMVELDYRYVTTWSLGNDLKLMCKTLPAMLRERSTY
jgi:exopolysaccharide biosynthesis polyprenyl glycosylphosphotransferase